MNDINHEFDEVIESYTEAINEDPTNPEAYVGRGIAKMTVEDYQGAIEDFSEALKLNPDDSETYITRGNAMHSLGDYYRAIADYSAAIKLDISNAEAYKYRASAKKELGDINGYQQDLAKATELNPNLSLLEESITIKENDKLREFIDKGDEKALEGDFYEAIAQYTSAIDLDNNSFGAYFGRAMAKLSLEDYKGAIIDLERVYAIVPDFIEAILTCADAKAKLMILLEP